MSGFENAGLMGSLFAIILGMLAFMIFLSIAVWIYTSFAFMAIAKKNKQDLPGLAWIPIVGPLIISFKAAKMHWWPWLLIIGFFIPLINVISLIVFVVYAFIWQWRLFEAIGEPGWWPLLILIPFFGGIVYLVLIGIAAWSK